MEPAGGKKMVTKIEDLKQKTKQMKEEKNSYSLKDIKVEEEEK